MDSLYRFPAPDFRSGYQIPFPDTPQPEAVIFFYLDLLVLAAALVLTGYFAIRRRSRRGLAFTLAGSLLYFGFVRGGCVCSVGAIQNVALAIADSTYSLPLTAALFFLIPLVTALFFGRLFCGGACPLGAAQDLVLIRPVSVPKKLDQPLRLLAPVYLGVSVLAAATGSGFLICRFDPFVSLFRFSGPLYMIAAGFAVLGISTFVFRPYCRYLCPYGVILGWLSRFSWKHLSLHTASCVSCGYCEESCPEGVILPPLPETEARNKTGLKRFSILILLLPLFIGAGIFSGYLLHVPASRLHATMRLAERIERENNGLVEGTTDYSGAFRESGKPEEQLFSEAAAIEKTFKWGTPLLGAFLGLVFGLRLLSLASVRKRETYTIDKTDCVSCGRCIDACPVERKTRVKRG